MTICDGADDSLEDTDELPRHILYTVLYLSPMYHYDTKFFLLGVLGPHVAH